MTINRLDLFTIRYLTIIILLYSDITFKINFNLSPHFYYYSAVIITKTVTYFVGVIFYVINLSVRSVLYAKIIKFYVYTNL